MENIKMSISHYSSLDLPETTLWWTQQQHPQPKSTWFNPPHTLHQDPLSKHTTNKPKYFNLNHQNQQQQEHEEEEEKDNNNKNKTTTSQLEDEKEPMFEKPLTPSDVGKLNRLVIPKQHAEKYFPLGANNNNNKGGGGDSGECKGILLSFEDESGKCWRFRYSYWNSSQSYVLTKGWSRYVKDKRLDAGDVVLFERHSADAHRLFIRWRRRRGTEMAHVSRGFYSARPYPTHWNLPNCQHAGRGGSQGLNERTRPLGNSCSSTSSNPSSRVLRLFGVNMEYQLQQDSGPSTTPQCSSYTMPSKHPTNTPNFYNHHQPSYSSNPPHQPCYY